MGGLGSLSEAFPEPGVAVVARREERGTTTQESTPDLASRTVKPTTPTDRAAPASTDPDRIARWTNRLAAAALLFVYGFATAHFRWPPAGFLATAMSEGRAWFTKDKPLDHHYRPARHEFAGVSPESRTTSQHITLLTGYWPEHGWRAGVRLIDASGQVLHHWHTVPDELWPVSPYSDAIARTFPANRSAVHGTHVFDDGDLVCNLEYYGLVRLSAAGTVKWRLSRRTHHSIAVADDGSLWVCAMNWRSALSDLYPRLAGLAPPLQEDTVMQISPAGEVLREISVYDVLFHNGMQDQIWRRGRTGPDLVHLNDVEPLPAALAPQYPLFAAGDLLVSLRDLDTVMVFDPTTLRVKWWSDRPFMRQHDPDFLGDGWVSVFDNHPDGAPQGQFLGGSRLLRVRPHTGEVEVIYAPGATPKVGGGRPFYTDLGGKAQQLSTGGWLLTEAMAGRVFEIDTHGEVVWEWAQARTPDGTLVSEVMEGTRYGFTREQVAAWPRAAAEGAPKKSHR